MEEQEIKATQLAAVRKVLESGGTITPLQAFDLCGTIRLSAIIYKLRHNEGLPIKNLNTRDKFAIYSL